MVEETPGKIGGSLVLQQQKNTEMVLWLSNESLMSCVSLAYLLWKKRQDGMKTGGYMDGGRGGREGEGGGR